MSDDTPTQRFPEQGGDQPTERIATGEVYEELGEERQKSRGLLIGLIAAGALLLIAIIVILFVIFGNKGASSDDDALPSPAASDSASPEPSVSDTPSATAEPTSQPSATQAPPPPPPAALSIDTFKVSPSTWTCNSSAPNPVPDPKLSFVWNTSNATHVYFAVGKVSDAESMGQGWDLPEDGNQASFPDGAEFSFYCPAASQSYTLTAKDDNGHSATKTVTVVNNGDKQ